MTQDLFQDPHRGHVSRPCLHLLWIDPTCVDATGWLVFRVWWIVSNVAMIFQDAFEGAIFERINIMQLSSAVRSKFVQGEEKRVRT